MYHVRESLDTARMAQAFAYLEGERDFAPFAGRVPTGKGTVRRLYRTAVWREGAEVHMEVEGNAFLPQQVRRMAGAVLEVGLGRCSLEQFMALADSPVSGVADRVLPPGGLCLREVKYTAFPPREDERSTDNATHTASPVAA